MIVLVKGESIEELAAKYQTTVEKIKKDNGIGSIREGMRLWIESTIEYAVGPFDTVESIAALWGVPREDVLSDEVKVGRKVKIKI